MPRYLVERDFPDGLAIPMNDAGAGLRRGIIEANQEEGVTWIVSYVAPGRHHTYCLYDGPTPEAIRAAAARCHLPITRITEVRVLEPYSYR